MTAPKPETPETSEEATATGLVAFRRRLGSPDDATFGGAYHGQTLSLAAVAGICAALEVERLRKVRAFLGLSEQRDSARRRLSAVVEAVPHRQVLDYDGDGLSRCELRCLRCKLEKLSRGEG